MGASIHRLDYTVVPDNDLVPRVDEQLGTQILTRCDSGNPKLCHSIGETLCDLLVSCGSAGFPQDVEVNCALCPKHAHYFKDCAETPEVPGTAKAQTHDLS